MITVEKLEKGTYFDDAFKISFRYDPTTVAKVKELAERRYLPEDRAWEIPAHELPALIEKVVEEMFLTCKDEIHFIIEHYNSYKQMPDKLTFLGRFKDFQMLEVTESTDYLVYKLKEAYTYTKLVPLIEDTAKVVKEDSIKAIQYLKEEIEKLEKSVPVSRNKDGYDIISNAGDRLTEYKKRCEVKGLIGIPTGIPKLDEITNGWLLSLIHI